MIQTFRLLSMIGGVIVIAIGNCDPTLPAVREVHNSHTVQAMRYTSSYRPPDAPHNVVAVTAELRQTRRCSLEH
jgi:hypothetical protein